VLFICFGAAKSKTPIRREKIFWAAHLRRHWEACLCLKTQSEKLVRSLRLVAYCCKYQLPWTDPHGLPSNCHSDVTLMTLVGV
jgi:hypothetical protein